MELSNYELIRYPSGQLVLTRLGVTASGPRDIVGVFTSEAEAQRALDRLVGNKPGAKSTVDIARLLPA